MKKRYKTTGRMFRDGGYFIWDNFLQQYVKRKDHTSKDYGSAKKAQEECRKLNRAVDNR